MREQAETAAAPPQPLSNIAASPLILTYHAIAPDAEGPYNITPARFAQDMSSLHGAGWTTIGTDAFLDWLYGRRTLPPRTVLLTFDDGNAGTWIYADPILRRYGFRGVAFIVTGFIAQGNYYLTWPELQALRTSGRWDIESHAHLGHSDVPSDAHLTPAPFLINRRWMSDRLESPDTFRKRVTRDLEANVRTLRDRGFSQPRLFAYPFASASRPTNDAAAATYTQELVQRSFEGSMTDDALIARTTRPRPHDIPRVGITSDVDLPSLFRRQHPAEV